MIQLLLLIVSKFRQGNFPFVYLVKKVSPKQYCGDKIRVELISREPVFLIPSLLTLPMRFYQPLAVWLLQEKVLKYLRFPSCSFSKNSPALPTSHNTYLLRLYRKKHPLSSQLAYLHDKPHLHKVCANHPPDSTCWKPKHFWIPDSFHYCFSYYWQ